MAMVGWLVWPDAHRPRRVHPIAVAALQGVEWFVDLAGCGTVGDRCGSVVRLTIEESLLSLGASTAVTVAVTSLRGKLR